MVPPSRAALALPLWLAVAALAWAQPAAPAKRPDPADAQANVPPLVYRSAVPKSAPPAEVPVGSWPQANETVWRIGGWRAYAREAAQADAPRDTQSSRPDKPREAAAPAASAPGARR
jgi:hypothetical protein